MVIIYVIPKKSIFYYMEIFSIHGNLRSQLFVDSDGNKRKMGTGGGGGGGICDSQNSKRTGQVRSQNELGDGVSRIWPKSLILLQDEGRPTSQGGSPHRLQEQYSAACVLS